VFWNAIDNCEYSGVAVVFAAGNEGTRGLRTPGDRITNSVSTFSVGALKADQQTIASFSSRGPSKCDNQTIKPEICAHGESVRSSLPNNRYGNLSGTSMATPAITGGVALLRQAWPDVTSRRVKELMLETADDLGPAGEDNAYGMGRANLLAAYNKMMAERPVVAMSVVGVVRKVKEGTSAYARVFLTNNTSQLQGVRLSLVLTYNGGTMPLMFLPPTDLDVPANFTNASAALIIELPVPAGLGAIALEPNTWSIRARVEPKGGGTMVHTSEYEFVVTP